MEKLIITACICGAEVTKEQNEAVPYTVAEIKREAKSAYEAGAAVLHLHVREDDGSPTQRKDRFKVCMEAIKSLCSDMIIQVSTGGAAGMSREERLQPLALYPEMATLDCGTCNFGGDVVFVNTENMIREFAAAMNARQVRPELEVFDKGMIDTVMRLHAKGYIKAPLHFNFVMGVKGGISAGARDLLFMAESIPKEATWTAAGIGKHEFPMAALAIVMGGHVRVGFEDNVCLQKGRPAKSNGELVAKAVRLAKELGRDIADPSDARRILNLPKRD